MVEPRSSDIRINEIGEDILSRLRFNVSPVGDFKSVVCLTSDSELFVEVYQRKAGASGIGSWRAFRIMFDHDTTAKIRTLFRRQGGS